jgi:bud site selection protein 20
MPAIRGQDSKKKTRRHTRDLDQIHADLHDEKHLAEFKEARPIEDLPGLGQWYCKECAKFFESEANFGAHQKGKVHKRRSEYS